MRYLILLLLTISAVEARFLGTQEIEFTIPGSDRRLVAEIYYPTLKGESEKMVPHGIWTRRVSTQNAPLAPQKAPYPLVIFSHGRSGDRFRNSWVAEALVDAGYIVAMIEHTHDTSYERSDAFSYTSPWQRPLDLSALLDYLLQDPTWAKVIDKHKIVAGGLSRGGLTALWTAGIEGDPVAFKKAMQPYARWNDWPQSIKKEASEVNWTKAGRSYYDPRIKTAVAIAPYLGKAFKPEGIKQAKVPVLVIVGDKDVTTPSDTNAGYYASHIPDAELFTIKNANHYTFHNNCSLAGMEKARVSHLCRGDSPEFRERAHKEAADKIIGFLKEKLQQDQISKINIQSSLPFVPSA